MHLETPSPESNPPATPPWTELGVWVLNLDRAPERLQRLGPKLDALGLPWERFSAVEGKALSAAEQAQHCDREGFGRWHGMTPTLGELGCYLSHVRVLDAFLASSKRFGLILEDDVQPRPELPQVLQALMAVPQRWDLVKLSAIHSGTPLTVHRLTPDYTLAVMLSRCTGSSAYVLNREAARRYRAGLLPMQLPHDHAFNRGWVFGVEVLRVVPEVCVHDDQVESTIGNPGASRKFHWTRRWSTYGFRLRTELRRLVHGLAQGLTQKVKFGLSRGVSGVSRER